MGRDQLIEQVVDAESAMANIEELAWLIRQISEVGQEALAAGETKRVELAFKTIWRMAEEARRAALPEKSAV